MWWSSLILLLLAVAQVVTAADPCLKTADHRVINKIFSDGGPGTKVFLCPSRVYKLWGTIVFTAADQELATEGYPTGDERATLRVESEILVTAIQGDCRRCARVALRSVVIDGGRTRLGRSQDEAAPGLVVLGGNEGQRVSECALKNPRGWTALHVREGAKLQCKGAVVEHNQIGPAGEEYDPAVDGPDPETSPLGRPLADGISIACRDSIVRDNTLVDCTDAGIVVYCSPGTVISGNTVRTASSSAMGGLLMVDATPFDGDYSGVIVKDNIFDAAASAMRVGIGIGLSILSDDIETILRGGTVTHNALQGQFMGYGIAASGLKDWTITDNHSSARHQGKRSARCFDDVVNPDPMPFLFHKATIDGTMQSDFHDEDFAYAVCIDGLDESTGQDFPPIETPAPEEEAKADPKAMTGTGSDALDGILLHVQQSMMTAIGILGRNADIAINAAKSGGAKRAPSPGVDSTLSDIEARLDTLERAQAGVMANTDRLHRHIKKLTQDMQEAHVWQTDVLLHIEQEFYAKPAPPKEAAEPARSAEPPRTTSTTTAGMPLLYVLAGAVLAALGYRFYTAYRTARKPRSSSKTK